MACFDRFSRAGLALVAAGCLAMAGCSASKQAANDVGDAAKTAASATGDAAQDAASGAGDAAKTAASATGDAAKTAASGVGDAAKNMATAAGQAALAPALNPVLDLLSKGQADLKAGNLGAAITAMGGFQSLWEKAGPVIQPLAGDKWGTIDSAAKTVISTFRSGAKPDATAAGSAISGLMGPLKALAGK